MPQYAIKKILDSPHGKKEAGSGELKMVTNPKDIYISNILWANIKRGHNYVLSTKLKQMSHSAQLPFCLFFFSVYFTILFHISFY